jgi:hypothetical protein
MLGHISQSLGHEFAAPGGMSRRWILVDHSQDALLGTFIVLLECPWTGRILETRQTVLGEAGTPFAHCGWSDVQPLGDELCILAFCSLENDPCSKYHPLFGLGGADPLLKSPLFLSRQFDGGCLPAHATNYNKWR